MCGIAGYFGFELSASDGEAALSRMCGALRHRGPDDNGIFVSDGIGICMTRLSIIDIEGGHQPMSARQGALQIVFNGEIYNYRELRRELQSAGEIFKTSTDTEVLLKLYERHGERCLERLNGMFAFAIWDGAAQSLFMARDRLGIKPLFYHWDGRRLLFGSELKAIARSGLMNAELDMKGVWDYLTFRYIPQPGSIWKGVRKLEPGHAMRVSRGDGDPKLVRYWDIPYGEERGVKDAPERFGWLFEDAVKLRLIADVPVGVLLSGGLDSSCVAAAIANSHDAGMASFSVGFEGEPSIDELPYARSVAKKFSLECNEIVIGEREFIDFLPEFVLHADEPLADLASIPLHYVSKLASGKVKVVLSGEGSDEILAGYNFHEWQAWNKRRVRGEGGWLSRLMGHGRKAEELWELPAPPHMTNFMDSGSKSALLSGGLRFRDSMEVVRDAFKSCRSMEPLNQMLYSYCQGWLADDLLAKADRMSMANSLELRTPFLDYRLVEFAAMLPASWKVGKAPSGASETKHILKEYARLVLPKEIVERPKMGFPVPAYRWLSGGLKGWAQDTLAGGGSFLSGICDAAEVDKALEAGIATDAGAAERAKLWNLLVLEIWGREWGNG